MNASICLQIEPFNMRVCEMLQCAKHTKTNRITPDVNKGAQSCQDEIRNPARPDASMVLRPAGISFGSCWSPSGYRNRPSAGTRYMCRDCWMRCSQTRSKVFPKTRLLAISDGRRARVSGRTGGFASWWMRCSCCSWTPPACNRPSWSFRTAGLKAGRFCRRLTRPSRGGRYRRRG